MIKEHTFVSLQCLYVMHGKSSDWLEYNFFKKLVCVICIVASDKFTIKALLCYTQYLFIVHSSEQHTQNALLCFHYNNSCANVPQCYMICTLCILCFAVTLCIACETGCVNQFAMTGHTCIEALYSSYRSCYN